MQKKTANEIDTHVGNRIRLRRMMLGISQEKLGDALGITFQQIQKYEKGKNRVGASRLFATAEVLKVPVAFFFDGLGETTDDASAELAGLMSDKASIDLLRGFNSLDRNGRQGMLKIMETLISLKVGLKTGRRDLSVAA